MKNTFKFLSIAVLAAVVLYFSVQIYQYFTDPFSTTLAYSSESTESIHMDGWIVRQEQCFSTDAVTLRHTCAEGAKIGVGQQIAVTYSSDEALEVVEKMETLELKLQQLEYALSTYLDADASLKLESSIYDDLLQLQATLSRGDYAAAADDVDDLKASVLKRNHSFSSEEEIQAAIDDTKAELSDLRRSLSGAEAITAPQSGTYSTACDGYETILTPKLTETLTPSVLESIKPAEDAIGNAGKMIYGSTWYFCANIPTQQADQLSVGQSAPLRFAKGFEQDITMTVCRISAEENGMKTVVLSGNRYLAQTTQLRHQQAELVLHTYSGLRVPSQALRTDENNQAGLYCVVGVTAQFKPVQVVYRGDGYTLVKPTADAAGVTMLRSGDEVILSSNDVESGMVVG